MKSRVVCGSSPLLIARDAGFNAVCEDVLAV